jgi:hypothetical protein
LCASDDGEARRGEVEDAEPRQNANNKYGDGDGDGDDGGIKRKTPSVSVSDMTSGACSWTHEIPVGPPSRTMLIICGVVCG